MSATGDFHTHEASKMTDSRPDGRLRLPDLSISQFRGIESLEIGRLGRVTLLTGRNGVGKTTVLEAVRVFASRGAPRELSDILVNREEESQLTDDGGDRVAVPNVSALFYGRHIGGHGISIGSASVDDIVEIRQVDPPDEQMPLRFGTGASIDVPARVLASIHRKVQRLLPPILLRPGSTSKRQYHRAYGLFGAQSDIFGDIGATPDINCTSLGPELLSNKQLARWWSTIALTDEEDRAVRALNLALGDSVERVTVIDREDRFGRNGRSAVVKLRGEGRPVPLKSLGDGAVRLLSVALGLANSVGGFLLIDEAENGIHHSVQRDFWRMVMETARKNNVQVLATTHSWDCVRGFAQAANELEAIEGALVRIEKRNKDMWAVEYLEDQLRVVADQGIEVR